MKYIYNMFEDTNFCGFLWSPVKDYWNEILSYLNKIHIINEYKIYEFNNFEQFETCIIKIYELDDIDINKVKKIKINAFKEYDYSFLFFKFRINEPAFRKKQINGNPISKTVENIKINIRGSYKNKIKNYTHDIIIHIADNYQQTNLLNDLINNYNIDKAYHFINLKYFLDKNIINNEFSRIDMLVRYLTIKNFIENKNYDFSIYRKMQSERIKVNTNTCVEKFKELIFSLEENGFDIKYPILYSDDYKLLNGSHRLSWCYYKNLVFIPIKKMQGDNHHPYDLNFFINKKFNENTINLLREEANILKKYISN